MGPFVHHLTMAVLAGKAEVDFSKTMEIKLGQNYYDLSKETDLQQRDELSIKYPFDLIFRTHVNDLCWITDITGYK